MNLEAFQTRILPAKNKLFRFAQRLLGNTEEAQDVVQEVFIKVWNGREQMNDIQNWEAWCMRLTKNLSLDRLRAQQRRSSDSIENNVNISNDSLTPYQSAEQQESMKHISQFINTLPEKQRQIIHLRDVEGYSYNEICDMLELDMNSVKVNLFRARNAVREKFVKINAYGI